MRNVGDIIKCKLDDGILIKAVIVSMFYDNYTVLEFPYVIPRTNHIINESSITFPLQVDFLRENIAFQNRNDYPFVYAMK